MVSAAALAGVRAHGRQWKYELSLHGQPQRLARPDDLVRGDCATIRDTIVRDLKGFLARAGRHAPSKDLHAALGAYADDLEMIADDPDELIAALHRLYDICDFHRVCIVA